MLKYSIQVRSGTQIRLNPTTNSQSRINPLRDLRPMPAAHTARPPSSTHPHCDIDEKFLGQIALSEESLRTITKLTTVGITKEQLLSLFPFYPESAIITKETNLDNTQPVPILQYYPRESDFKKTKLPQPLQELIEKSLKVNPFAPVSSLVANVCPLQDNVLCTLKQRSTQMLTFKKGEDILQYHPTSSVYNYFIYSTLFPENLPDSILDTGIVHDSQCRLCADKPKLEVNKAPEEISCQNSQTLHSTGSESSKQEEELYILKPYHIHFDQETCALSYSDNVLGEIYHELKNATSANEDAAGKQYLTESFVKESILSPTGQLWGNFCVRSEIEPANKSTDLGTHADSSALVPMIGHSDDNSRTPVQYPVRLKHGGSIQFGIPAIGESSLFYNKFPFAQFHSVVTITEAPFVHIKDFSVRQMNCALHLIVAFFNAVQYNFDQTVVPLDIDYTINVLQEEHHHPETTENTPGTGIEGFSVNTTRVPLTKIITEHQKSLNDNPAVGSVKKTIQTIQNSHTNQDGNVVATDLTGIPETPLFPTLLWNYMPSSAGSLIHPHWQCFIEDGPTGRLVDLLRNSYKFRLEQYKREQAQSLSQQPPQISYTSKYNLAKAVLMFEYALHKQFLKDIADGTQIIPPLDLTNPHSFVQQSRYIASIPIPCSCTQCNGLSVHLTVPFAPLMSNEILINIVNLEENSGDHQSESTHQPPQSHAMSITSIKSITPSQRGHISSIVELTCPVMNKAIAKAIFLILSIYTNLNVMALNMATLSASTANYQFVEEIHKNMREKAQDKSDVGVLGPGVEDVDMNDVILTFTFVSRPYPSGLYANDSGCLERLLSSQVTSTPPEVYAANYRAIIAENDLLNL